jgi:hypothetical protein
MDMKDGVRRKGNSYPIREILHWILSPGVCRETSPNKGGIAGWIRGDGSYDFIYGEMAAYYLSLLVYLQESGLVGSLSAEKFLATLEWLESWLQCGQMPPTRIYIHNQSSRDADWRCRYYFSFDQAMIWRAAEGCGRLGLEAGQRIQGLLLVPLQCFCPTTDSLYPLLDVHGKPAVASHSWSTRPGSFQLKTAAALCFHSLIPLPERLTAACESIFRQWKDKDVDNFFGGHLHADLYALEGLLLFGLHRQEEVLPSLSDKFAALWKWYAATDGKKNPRVFSDLGERTDVPIQFLRLGCCLLSLGLLDKDCWMPRFCRLACSLEERIGEYGGVAFQPLSAPEVHWNVWCAIFAVQAFHFLFLLQSGKSIPRKSMERLI